MPRPSLPTAVTQLQNITVGGSLLGNVDCSGGSIVNLLVSGTVGTITSPVTVIARNDAVITKISCSAFYGTVRGPGAFSSATIGEFRTTAGPIVGELKVAGINAANGSGLFCNGDLDAIVGINGTANKPIQVSGKLVAGRVCTITTLNSDVSFDRLEAGSTLRINGSLPSGKTLTFGTDAAHPGLAGQVIINSTNGAGTWAGTVRVGGSGGTPYTQSALAGVSSGSLGGGSVGVAPFGLWSRDSFPPTIGSGASAVVGL